MHEFESFETQKFVGRLLGRGDWGSFIDKVKDVIPEVRRYRWRYRLPAVPPCMLLAWLAPISCGAQPQEAAAPSRVLHPGALIPCLAATSTAAASSPPAGRCAAGAD